MDIYLRIKEVVTESGMTQAAVAEKIGINRQYFYQLLSGRNNPSLEVLISISELLGVNLHWLLKGEGQKYINREVQPKAETSNDNELMKELLNLYRFIAEQGLKVPPGIGTARPA